MDCFAWNDPGRTGHHDGFAAAVVGAREHDVAPANATASPHCAGGRSDCGSQPGRNFQTSEHSSSRRFRSWGGGSLPVEYRQRRFGPGTHLTQASAVFNTNAESAWPVRSGDFALFPKPVATASAAGKQEPASADAAQRGTAEIRTAGPDVCPARGAWGAGNRF